MSDTPRTKAHAMAADEWAYNTLVCDATFTQALERELAESARKLEEAKRQCLELTDAWNRETAAKFIQMGEKTLLQQQLAEARKDAERYRFLRDNSGMYEQRYHILELIGKEFARAFRWGKRLDDEIDAAMEASK